MRLSTLVWTKWLSYVLETDDIYNEAYISWVNTWTKRSLLSQAWFVENEIEVILNSQWKSESTNIDDVALKEMNENVERIVEEYLIAIQNLDNIDFLRRYSNETIIRIIELHEEELD